MKSRVDYIKENMAGKVLDLGCNTGRLHGLIDDGKMIGLDVIIPKAGKRLVRGSALAMPFKDGSFDTIIAGELLEHFNEKDGEKFLGECRRVLGKNGIAIISTPNIKAWSNRLFGKFESANPDDYSGHLKVYTIGELRGLCSKYFRIEDFFLLPYDEVASPNQKWFIYPLRKLVHYFLPNSLREEMIIKMRKVK